MSDGQEIPEEFPAARCNYIIMDECHTTKHESIVQVVCHGCGAMIEDVVLGEDGWLFCPCGTGLIKVTM